MKVMRRTTAFVAFSIVASIGAAIAAQSSSQTGQGRPAAVPASVQVITGTRAAAAFAVDGIAVHPFCFRALDSYRTTPKNVSGCGDPAVEVTIKSDGWREVTVSGPPVEWYSYRVLAQKGDRFFLLTDLNGGGTGKFTSVSWVRLADRKVNTVAEVRGGDRCAGGISEASVAAQTARYDVNLTTADLVLLVRPDLDRATADRLSRVYQGCAAYAEYRYDLIRETEQLASVTLSPQEPAQENPDSRLSPADPQACFEGMAAQQIKTTGTKLSLAQLQDFGRRFIITCTPAGPPGRR
jgi:hypothetical protein